MSFETRALILDQPLTLPQLEPVSIDDPGPGEVRVRLSVSGVCHTDFTAVRDARRWPMVLGHEGSGIVESVGEGVTHLQPGDHVILSCRVPCGICRRCQSGRQDLCENVLATGAPRVHRRDGRALYLLGNVGAFCPYVTVPAGGAIAVRRDMPLDRAALISCGVTTGLGAALRTAAIEIGDAVAVFGAGGVGLNVIQGARLANAGMIIAIDVVESKLKHARDFGATHVVRADQADPVQAVLDLTHGRGVEHAFEVVGLPTLMDQALSTLGVGGTLVLVGGAPHDATFAIHPRAVLANQQTIRGCNYGSCRPALDFPLFADWYMQGKLKLDVMISDEIGLEQLPHLYETHAAPDAIRTVVRFDEQS
jgi:S-(hydroxymethyl)glutathione dehydrogenase/alcohol dehydrogenase